MGITISNLWEKKLESLLKTAKLKLVLNQVEIQAYFQPDKLTTYSNNKDILTQGCNSKAS